jgi:cytochrome c oxidase assembly factor CtaG
MLGTLATATAAGTTHGLLNTARATPGWGDWSLDPPVLGTLAVAILYRLGARRTITPARKRTAQRWRDASFYAGIAVLAIALASPIDPLSERLFWVHMIQHVLLIAVAAPLIVLARPWIRLWRCLPLGARRWLARGLSQGARTAPLRTASRFLGRPTPSFVAFSAALLAWHVPVLFEATLRSSALHALEHTLFLLTAIMFFKQAIPSPPLRTLLRAPQRVAYAIGGMIVSWALAVVLALAPAPLYGHYAHLPTRPGGISALADQQLAAGVMWVPGSITFLIVVLVYVNRWLAPGAPASTSAPRLAGGHR